MLVSGYDCSCGFRLLCFHSVGFISFRRGAFAGLCWWHFLFLRLLWGWLYMQALL